MSLTSLLKNNDEIQDLFDTIPDVTKDLRRCNGTRASSTPSIVVPRKRGASPALVGTAFDFLCRAFVQRANKKNHEILLSPQVLQGFKNIRRDPRMTDSAYGKLQTYIYSGWETRRRYIEGEHIPVKALLEDSLLFAYCEQVYRSGHVPPTSTLTDAGFFTYREDDVSDLHRLLQLMESSPKLLTTQQEIYMNPHFGEYSTMVGGADADMVFGTTLIDMKTTVHLNDIQDYFRQLIGYYLLSTYDNTFARPLENLAVYLPRFDMLLFLPISVLNQRVNMKHFSNQFLRIIGGLT